MIKKLNSFTKVVILIFGLLVLMMLLFAIYNHTTVQVIKSEIETTNQNKLLFFKSQLEEKLNQISITSITLANDPAIKELEYQQQSGDPYDKQKWTNMILDHIYLQSEITGWRTEISVYSRRAGEVISTSSKLFDFDDEELVREIAKGWQFHGGTGQEPDRLVWYSVTPANAYVNPAAASLIVKTSLDITYLQRMLDQYKPDGQGDPLLYHPELGIIGNRSIDTDYAKEITEYLRTIPLDQEMLNVEQTLSGEKHLLSFLPIYGFDWYLVDSIPVDQILAPVTKARNLFYTFALILLITGILASYILYRQLQVPIRGLVRSIQGIKRGDYSSRIRLEGQGEFHFLIKRFNEMAEEIQQLLEKVYEERIRSREAMLKQLQSQINPHFLYNCLFFIKNMTRLGEEEAVVAMALNLGEYFRYTTRAGKPTAQLEEELGMIINYLEIQNLRTNRIHYQIDVPEEMRTVILPRLILQPIIENAVIHGIEPKEGQGSIRITGTRDGANCRITVKDNGLGIDEAAANKLRRRLEQVENVDNDSFGLWNVNRRLKLLFGEQAGVTIARNNEGGTAISIMFSLSGKMVGMNSSVPVQKGGESVVPDLIGR